MLKDSLDYEDINISEERVAQQVEDPAFFLASQDALEGQKYLFEIVQSQAREIMALNAKLEAMQKDMDSLATNDLNQLRLIAQLRRDKEPSNTETARTERVEKLCIDSPNHTISLAELRGRLGIDKAVLSRLLKRVNHDRLPRRVEGVEKDELEPPVCPDDINPVPLSKENGIWQAVHQLRISVFSGLKNNKPGITAKVSYKPTLEEIEFALQIIDHTNKLRALSEGNRSPVVYGPDQITEEFISRVLIKGKPRPYTIEIEPTT
jgi:DNA-binding MarR family transcriptional regulator